MPGPLGCPDTYTAALFDNRGEAPLGAALEVSEVKWGRLLDDTSTAEVTIPIKDTACCEALGDARTWCNDLGLYRDGDLVWQGPINGLDHGTDDTKISAVDVTGWLSGTEVFAAFDTTTATGTGPLDLALIAQKLITEGFTEFDPNVLPFLAVTLTGIPGERKYDAKQTYVGDEVRELARTGLDFTALGRRIIIGPEAAFARLAQLQDDDFLGELRVREDGSGYISEAIVIGTGVTATAGGVGTCGKRTRIVKEESIEDMASAQAEADSLVRAGTPAPLILDVPDGVQLSPECPVTIADLVPGVVIPVASISTCRTVFTDMRLLKVDVSYTADDGESVKVTLAPLGVELDN